MPYGEDYYMQYIWKFYFTDNYIIFKCTFDDTLVRNLTNVGSEDISRTL